MFVIADTLSGTYKFVLVLHLLSAIVGFDGTERRACRRVDSEPQRTGDAQGRAGAAAREHAEAGVVCVHGVGPGAYRSRFQSLMAEVA